MNPFISTTYSGSDWQKQRLQTASSTGEEAVVSAYFKQGDKKEPLTK